MKLLAILFGAAFCKKPKFECLKLVKSGSNKIL